MRHGYGEFIEKNGVGKQRARGLLLPLPQPPPAGSIVGTFEHGLPCGDAVRVMASGAKYSGGFVAGLYCGRGSALFFDGSCYEGEWEAGLRSHRGRWVHEHCDHAPPGVLRKVFEAVMAVVGGSAEGVLEGEQGDDELRTRADAARHGDYPAAATQMPTTVSAAQTAPAAAVTPPDVLSTPIPGKIGGNGALDAGASGNPSGSPPPLPRASSRTTFWFPIPWSARSLRRLQGTRPLTCRAKCCTRFCHSTIDNV